MNAVNFTQNNYLKVDDMLNVLQKKLPVISFCHDITTHANQHAMLTNNPNLSKLYQINKLPFNLMAENGKRTIPYGFSTSRTIESEYWLNLHTFHNFNAATRSTLHILLHEEDSTYTSLYSFSMKCSEGTFDSILINELGLISNFVEEYKKALHTELKEAHDTKCQQLIPFPCDKVKSKAQNVYINKFTGELLKVTRQQNKVLDLFLKGNATKAIAFELGLSQRTVQHYLDAIRHNNRIASSSMILLAVDCIS